MSNRHENMDELPYAKPALDTVGRLGEQLATAGVTKEQVEAYLSGAPVIRTVVRLLPDEVSNKPHQIPDLLRSDGVWRWHERLVRYVRAYDIEVPEDLLQHMIARGFAARG